MSGESSAAPAPGHAGHLATFPAGFTEPRTGRMPHRQPRDRHPQMSGCVTTRRVGPAGSERRQWPTATVNGHSWPVYGSSRLRAADRVTARDVPPVVSLLSRRAACREALSIHPGDKRPCGHPGDGVDPCGSSGNPFTRRTVGPARQHVSYTHSHVDIVGSPRYSSAIGS